MAYLKSANANRNFKIVISLLNNMANLPEVEVLADIKLEFMECCKYELPDPRLKIPYLFMKPIFSSGGGNTRTTIQRLAVLSCSSETESKLYSKVWKWIHKVSWESRDPTEARTRHPDGRLSKYNIKYANNYLLQYFCPKKAKPKRIVSSTWPSSFDESIIPKQNLLLKEYDIFIINNNKT